MKLIVVGGGITGLTIAYEAAKRGHQVRVFEKDALLGGLAGSFRVGDKWLEKFYHHIFKSDTAVVGLINELGLDERLVWRTSPMGFFHAGSIHRFGTPWDLLRFSPLSMIDRFKLGLAVLRFQRMTDWESLDSVTCEEWFSRHVSPNTYRVVWEPLLRLKFGRVYDQIPAAWIWGRIHPRARSRSRGGTKEELGYLMGGFQVLIEGMRREVEDKGGEVKENMPVETVLQHNGMAAGVVARGERFDADAVIVTTAVPPFLAMAPGLPGGYRESLERIGYQSAICLVLECTRSLSPIYWLNISDSEMTCGGVIEHTNFIPAGEYGGRHILYVFNYVNESHEYLSMNADDYYSAHEASLRRINPEFSRTWITRKHCFRARYATVVYTRGYRELMPGFVTPVPRLHMANTSQIYPYDRNMNNCIALGLRAAKTIFQDR